MCEIPPLMEDYYNDGKMPLCRELECESCNKVYMIDVWVGKEKVSCPNCGNPDMLYEGRHFPNARIIYISENAPGYLAICQDPRLKKEGSDRNLLLSEIENEIRVVKPGKEIIIVEGEEPL